MKKTKIMKMFAIFFSIVTVVGLCFSFVAARAARCFDLKADAALAAALLSFSNGDVFGEEPTAAPKARVQPLAVSAEPEKRPEKPALAAEAFSGETYPVEEINISSGNMRYQNISVKNNTDELLDIEKVLNTSLPFEISDDHRVQVLIFHTHTCESYLTSDEGFYYDSFYPRTTDEEKNVCAVGEEIANSLKARGVGVVHDTTLHDYPSYEGSYSRSFETIEGYLEKYPQIKVILDIHRDSMTSDDNVKYKPTFSYDGRKAAQIMIMTGHSEDGDFDFWDENLILALKLQKKCEDMYPGMTRPLNFGDFTYNMNANNGSLLIEVGTDANTVEEACRSGAFLGNALASVLTKSE